MATIVTRAGKGSPLTHDEVDDNFSNLNTDKVETSAIGTAAAANTGDFATAAQGVLADSALQDITGESIENLSDVASMTPADGQALVYGSGVWSAADMAGGIAYTRHTANVTIAANEGVIADTSGGAFTVTLPASPAVGDTVVITDGGDWATTNLTVGRNGSTIEGDAADMTMDIGGVAVQFTYDGTTWQIYTTAASDTSQFATAAQGALADTAVQPAGDVGFNPVAVTGTTPSLNVGTYNFFDNGVLTADTTVSFASVPTDARWSYSFEPSLVNDWDVSTASYLQSFSVTTQDTSPFDVFFKPDGTKMYVLGLVGRDINEYDLSTAWDISTASFLQLFSVSAQDTSVVGLFFKPDGTKMYVLGQVGDDVNEYDLSTAWDVSTAVYLQLFSVAATAGANPRGISFKPDGTKMYVVGPAADSVYEYDLSTAWDVSTAVYLQLFSIATQDTNPYDVSFKPDGTKMYVLGGSGDAINEYNLSTAWDVSTASYLQLFSVTTQDGIPLGIFFKPDGTKVYMVGGVGDSVYEYNVGSPTAVTLPAAVQNPPTEATTVGGYVTYEFATLDGGTTVTLINEEVL